MLPPMPSPPAAEIRDFWSRFGGWHSVDGEWSFRLLWVLFAHGRLGWMRCWVGVWFQGRAGHRAGVVCVHGKGDRGTASCGLAGGLRCTERRRTPAPLWRWHSGHTHLVPDGKRVLLLRVLEGSAPIALLDGRSGVSNGRTHRHSRVLYEATGSDRVPDCNVVRHWGLGDAEAAVQPCLVTPLLKDQPDVHTVGPRVAQGRHHVQLVHRARAQ
mmetsp:Transcript_27686/g.49953  ORF Transcript_27686/g.49953 Transcript_27686/m.49953 type:complete len:213 (+) Transcript_27686:376-1014(+)